MMDEDMMDEDMETSRFRHELEAESQHVLQEQVTGATFAHKFVSHTLPL